MAVKAIVTTSWDDGHKLDLRLAGLLAKYNMPATFYIAPKNREFAPQDLLTDAQVHTLGERFEIGSHTMTHPVMTDLTPAEITKEVTESKRYLTQLTGQPITTFCYPRGIYNQAAVQAVKDAGYTYARTVERFSLGRDMPLYEAPTSLEAHRGPIPTFYKDIVQLAKLSGFNPVKTAYSLDWEVLAKLMFDKAVANRGVFHFWGHSWVVEASGDWERLERVLAYISNHKDVNYLTNGQLAEELAK